jgi:hypothetical protein
MLLDLVGQRVRRFPESIHPLIRYLRRGARRTAIPILAWTFFEAAHFAIQYLPAAERFYERKAAQRGPILAMKALSHKLAVLAITLCGTRHRSIRPDCLVRFWRQRQSSDLVLGL